MSRDGSGNYNLPAGNPVVTGTVISSTQFNSTMTDIATAMTQSISKDGQTTPTNNLPMGGNRHTGVADGNLGNQYASINQTQNGSLNKATAVANVVDAYTASLTPAIAAYTDGQVVTLVPSVTNTTTGPTLALNGLAAKTIRKENGTTCDIGDILINVPIYLVYSSSVGGFLLLNPQRITGARISTPCVLPAPSSGNTLTVNGVAGGSPIAVGPGAVTAPSLTFTTAGNTGIWSSSAANLDIATASNNRVNINSTGNVTINAPGVGIALSVTGIASQYAGLFTGGGAAGTQKGLSVVTTTQNAADKILNVNNSLSNLLDIFGDGHGDLGPNLSWTVGGAWTIGAPTSGTALTLSGAAGSQGLTVTGSSTSGQSKGIYVNAGTTSADFSLLVQNQTGTANYFEVRGDGVVFGNDGAGNLFELGYKDTPFNAPGGSYTLVASDRGKTINIANGATITIPNGVFSAGAVVSFVLAAGSTATIAQGAGATLSWAGNGATTGNRTITGAALASLVYVNSSGAFISGAGLS